MYCVSIAYRECLRDFVPTVPTAPFYRQDTRCRGGGGVCPTPRDGAVLGCLVSLAATPGPVHLPASWRAGLVRREVEGERSPYRVR